MPRAAGSAGALPVGSPAPVPVPGVLQMIRTPRMLLPASSGAAHRGGSPTGWVGPSWFLFLTLRHQPQVALSSLSTPQELETPQEHKPAPSEPPTPLPRPDTSHPKVASVEPSVPLNPQGWHPQPGWSTSGVHPPPRAPQQGHLGASSPLLAGCTAGKTFGACKRGSLAPFPPPQPLRPCLHSCVPAA